MKTAVDQLISTLQAFKEELLAKNMNSMYGGPTANMAGNLPPMAPMQMAEKQEGVGMMRAMPKTESKVHIVDINKEECLEMCGNGQWNLKKKYKK